jgi:hypothetical protein
LLTNSNCPGYPIDFLPGDCGQVKPAGLKWDSNNNYLLQTWYPTYGTVESFNKNSIAAVTLNNDSHTMSLVGCWAASPGNWMQQVGGGVIIPPQNWIAANAGLLPPGPNGYWAMGLGGPTGTVQLVSNGPTMELVPVPAGGNGCTNGTIAPNPTPGGVILANYQASPLGPTCGGAPSLGCNNSGLAPQHPFPAKTAFTGYSSTLSSFWWDPYEGHGWFWGGTTFSMDWYDDGVVAGVLVPMSQVSGWANGTVASSPAPTYDPVSMTGSFTTNDPIDTHDGYQAHVGDAMWVQTCVANVDPDCGAENARDWTFITINSVSASAPYTITYRAWGLDYGSGGHVPVAGLKWWFGPFYGHGAIAGTFPRSMFRLQVIDPHEYTKVLDKSYPTPDLPTYHEDVDATALLPGWGGPAAGVGIAQNYNGANSMTGPSWSGADPDRQQFLVNVSFTPCTNGPNYSFCAQIYVWDIGH